MTLAGHVRKEFTRHFDGEPLLIRSPGRVNLIGEHTDYNDGFVLPAAIDKAIYFAISARKDQKCRLYALDKTEDHEFICSAPVFSEKQWPNYLVGIVDQFTKAGHSIGGFDCLFSGDIPIGAGLSSSAALETGFAFGLNELFDLKLDRLTLVKLAQKSENEFVGVRCGIMDQFVNVFGRKNTLLRLDCRSLQFVYIDFDVDVSIILFDTRVSRSLASSEYNKRREECTEGVQALRKKFPAVTHLRDATMDMLDATRHDIPTLIYRRCRYIIEENDRLLKACEDLKRKDLKTFGQRMLATHAGLSQEYEVSSKELDYLVELATDIPGVYGARMMGGGFGGCTINLVAPAAVDEVKKTVTRKYKEKFFREPLSYGVAVGEGTSTINIDENQSSAVQ